MQLSSTEMYIEAIPAVSCNRYRNDFQIFPSQCAVNGDLPYNLPVNFDYTPDARGRLAKDRCATMDRHAMNFFFPGKIDVAGKRPPRARLADPSRSKQRMK